MAGRRRSSRRGGRYYPKLQVAAPFSPVPGPRLLRRPGSPLPLDAIAQALRQACAELKLSSVHASFCTEAEWEALGTAGWLQRIGQQFHWMNAGYGSFDDFLGALASRKRKQLRRERRDANAAGLEFVTLRGPEIGRAQWEAFYGFYTSTVDRKWGSAYLTQRFFPMLGDRLGDRVVLMLALDRGRPVAGALNLLGEEALYGRNWGLQRRLAVPAFRALLLPRHRLRDRPWRRPRGGGRAGRAQDPARLPAAADLLGALDRASRAASRRRLVPRRGAPGASRGNGGARELLTLSSGPRLGRAPAAAFLPSGSCPCARVWQGVPPWFRI